MKVTNSIWNVPLITIVGLLTVFVADARLYSKPEIVVLLSLITVLASAMYIGLALLLMAMALTRPR